MEASTSVTRELTLEDAVSLAILLQKNNQLIGANEIFRRVLEAVPDHARALHYAGVLAHQEGRNQDSVSLIERSISLVPEQADWYSNLGIVLQSDDRLDLAIDAYRRAIAIDPSHANAHNNLGVLLRVTGHPLEAEAAYRAAIRLNPEHIDAHTNLGVLLNSLNRTEEAAACYCKAITLRPKYREARKLLALAHCVLGEITKATSIYREWLDEEPEDPVARHMLAACTGENVPERASDAFIEETFDRFSSTFEVKLAALSYRAPRLIATMLEHAGIEKSHHLNVLDAGCGTGFCGTVVAPYAQRLVGVDLSQGMLDQAKSKNIYDKLVKAELTEYMRENTESFNLIVSSDALVYFGDLSGILAAFAGALRPNGLLVFTLEHWIGEERCEHQLQLHGRYSHTKAYVERLLAALGLQMTITDAELRMESGRPVPGLVIRAKKSVQPSQ
jgi:predicted TPR repeat methyltransferase